MFALVVILQELDRGVALRLAPLLHARGTPLVISAANLAHIRQSRPDSVRAFEVKALHTFLSCSLFARKRLMGVCLYEQLLYINVQRFRGGLVFQAKSFDSSW